MPSDIDRRGNGSSELRHQSVGTTPNGQASAIASLSDARSAAGEYDDLHNALDETLPIIFIEEQSIIREALGRVFSEHLNRSVVSFASFEDALKAGELAISNFIIMKIGPAQLSDLMLKMQLIREFNNHCRLAVISGCEEPEQIRMLLGRGIHGFIPASLPLEVCLQALRLVQVGGAYVPTCCVSDTTGSFAPLADDPSLPRAALENASTASGADRAEDSEKRLQEKDQLSTQQETEDTEEIPQFTERQMQVIEVLRRGKSNKVIAYELELSEGTVKVHVRSIMRKLKAANRTEAAYLINKMNL